MSLYENILDAVGHTPTVQLQRLSPKGGATVFAKCEFMNPGGSIKDRMAVYIVRKALASGQLKPGGTIVENTSGNTGAGLALIASVLGCKLILTMPDKMSQEKIDTLRAFGAKVVVTPTNVPAEHPDSYYETAKRIAREIPGSFYVNQYHNPVNIEAHYELTGPELMADMESNVDAVVMGVGTGGTISGVGRYFKEKLPGTQVIGVDPVGSVYYDLFKTGRMPQPHVYKVEGIGEDMQCAALDMSVIDDMYQVTDKECFAATRRLAREEGLFAGGSSGAAVHIAMEVARKLGPGKRVATLLPDSGNRYLSKIYNEEWMRVNGFLDDETEFSAKDVLAAKGAGVLWLDSGATLLDAVAFLKERDISQAPVKDASGALVGTVSERALLTALVSGGAAEGRVADILEPALPLLAPDTTLTRLSEVLMGGSAALVGTQATQAGITGILTRIDIIEYLRTHR